MHCYNYSMNESKPKKRNKVKTINQIIKTTLELIDENGYDKLSTNHIAERAQIAIGTVYHHFPKGKPDIIRKIALDNFQMIISFDIFNNISDSNFDESLNQIIRNHIKTHQKDIAFNKAFDQAFLSNTKIFHGYSSSVDKEMMQFAGKLKKLNIFRKRSQEKLFINLIRIVK